MAGRPLTTAKETNDTSFGDENKPGSEMLQAAGWGAEGAHWAAVGQGYANAYSQMGQAYANQYSHMGQQYANEYAGVGQAYANRELNRSLFVNMPPTAFTCVVHFEAHGERRFCVPIANSAVI